MFCDIVKGLELTYTCIVLDLSLLLESRELDRTIRVSIYVSSVLRGSSSIATFLARGII
jgi:hypothetical protein